MKTAVLVLLILTLTSCGEKNGPGLTFGPLLPVSRSIFLHTNSKSTIGVAPFNFGFEIRGFLTSTDITFANPITKAYLKIGSATYEITEPIEIDRYMSENEPGSFGTFVIPGTVWIGSTGSHAVTVTLVYWDGTSLTKTYDEFITVLPPEES